VSKHRERTVQPGPDGVDNRVHQFRHDAIWLFPRTMVTTGRHDCANLNAVADMPVPRTEDRGSPPGMRQTEQARTWSPRLSRISDNPSIQGKVPSNG
jgi:hypothetical protein